MSKNKINIMFEYVAPIVSGINDLKYYLINVLDDCQRSQIKVLEEESLHDLSEVTYLV